VPTPKGNNVVIITGAGGSGVLLSDACVDNDLSLMAMPRIWMPHSASSFRPSGPPESVDITGGEADHVPEHRAPGSRRSAYSCAHSSVLAHDHHAADGVCALMVEVVDQMRAKGIEKPVVASLAGDVEVEEARRVPYQHGIAGIRISTEIPCRVRGEVQVAASGTYSALSCRALRGCTKFAQWRARGLLYSEVACDD